MIFSFIIISSGVEKNYTNSIKYNECLEFSRHQVNTLYDQQNLQRLKNPIY